MKTSKNRLILPGQDYPEDLYDLAREWAGPNPDLGEWNLAVKAAADELGYVLQKEEDYD